MDYIEKLKSLRFNFRPDEVIDYEALTTLAGSIIVGDEFDKYKEELFHTIQILVLVYGLDEQIAATKIDIDLNNLNLNDLNLWKYLVVALYNDMVSTCDFSISDKTRQLYYTVLNKLSENTELIGTNNNELICGEEKRNMPIDNSPYTFVEPNSTYTFTAPPSVPTMAPNQKTPTSSYANMMMQEPTKPAASYQPVEIVQCGVQDDLSMFNPDYLRDYVIKNNIIPYRCEICGMSEWQGKHLPLKLVHRDNIDKTNCSGNLMFLCPNCHSQVGKE